MRTSNPLYSLAANDPEGRLFNRSSLSSEDLEHVNEVMDAVGHLREVEQRIARAAERYMKLNTTDMRAVQYLMICMNAGEPASPSKLAQHLGITTASTTKLLDRLEKGGHIRRAGHPSDRRSLTIEVTPKTSEAAIATMGRVQAQRAKAAAALSDSEREAVLAFLRNTAEDLEQAINGTQGPI